jgi:cellobiose phosphorylase
MSTTAPALPYRFDDARRVVAVTDPRLPQPWINYLSNGDLHAFVSQAGGGLAWWKSPLKNRLTRYRQYNLPIDSPGFYVYLREADGSVWSPSWRPVETNLDAWRAEHQPGLTRFAARRGALEATLELFIAPGENSLVWDLTVTNRSGQPVHLDVFGYVELCLLDWKQDTDWACYVKHNLQVEWDAAAQAIVYVYRHFHFNSRLADCPLVHFAASAPVASWSADRDAFVGHYRDERNPVAVERNACDNQPTFCGDPAAALQVPLRITAGGSSRFQFFLSTEEHAIVAWPRALDAARATLVRLRAPGAVDKLRTALAAWWETHLGVLQADLPDADIARQVNTWSPVQTVHTARYSRSISQHAAGVRTLGYRDTCQDMLALAYRRPAQAAAMFRYLVSQQYEDGHTPHQCNPVEKLPAEAHIHIDNPYWLVLLAHALVCETGDLSLLDENLPWLSADDNLSHVGSASIWTHLLRIADFMEANLGAHGLPLSHKGDWNDSIGKFSKKGKGESLFAAQQYVFILRQLAELAGARRDEPDAARLDALREKQSAAILACAWDGAWWLRAFDDDGQPVGTHSSEFGKIWLNSQSWAVLSGVGSPEQNRRAMDSVAELLDTRHCGLQKLHPSYQSFPVVQEPYSGYSPGCGENGAIFCHANTWAIIAESLLGRPEKAWHYYRQLVPHLALQKVGLERYKAEPYAYVSNIIGPENPKYGWANVTQVSGTAAWMDIAVTQYLLGLRPQLDGLRIAPCLPADWPGFTATRIFRGTTIRIEVRRAVPGEKPGLTLDGQALPSDLIPATALAGKAAASAVRIL